MILPLSENFKLAPPWKDEYGESLDSAQDAGQFRDVEFLKEFLRRRYDGRVNITSINQACSFIEKLVPALEAVYPEQWDIMPELDVNGISELMRLSVVIHLDNVHIKNSEGLEHDMKHFLVKMKLDFTNLADKYCIHSLYGGRAQLYHYENSYPYHHSHLSTSSMPGVDDHDSMMNYTVFNDFCTRSNEMQQHLDEMKTLITHEQEELELFLYTMDSFLQWESLEGGPYRRIASIRRANDDEGENRTTEDPENYSLVNHIKRSPELFKLVYAKGRYRVVRDKTLKDSCKEYLLEDLSDNYLDLVMKVGKDWMSYPYSLVNSTEVDENTTVKYHKDGVPFHIKIRGRQIDFAVVQNPESDANTAEGDLNKYFVHPKLIENVCKRIESELYEKHAEREFAKAKLEGINA